MAALVAKFDSLDGHSSLATLLVCGYLRQQLTTENMPAPQCLSNLVKKFYFTFYYYLRRNISIEELSHQMIFSPSVPTVFKIPEHPRIDVVKIGRNPESNQLVLNSQRTIKVRDTDTQISLNRLISHRVKYIYQS